MRRWSWSAAEWRVSSDGGSERLTDKAEREGGVQRRETGSEKALMEVGGKLSAEEEYEERSGLESGLVEKKNMRARTGKKKIVRTVETRRFAEIVL